MLYKLVQKSPNVPVVEVGAAVARSLKDNRYGRKRRSAESGSITSPLSLSVFLVTHAVVLLCSTGTSRQSG
jgi:S-adenosylhomocysteine hydrolase